MRALKLFVSSVLGGACIGLGGVAYLSLENRLAGALFFTVGLFTICTFGSTCSQERSDMFFRRGDRPAAPAPHLAGEPCGHRGGGCGRAADQAGAPGGKGRRTLPG